MGPIILRRVLRTGMNKTHVIVFMASAFAVVGLAPHAEACMKRPQPNVRPTTIPSDLKSPTVVVTQPIRYTAIDANGRPYWRAIYEVIADRTGTVEPYRIAMEWACDPPGTDAADQCGILAPSVLPGFGADDRPDGARVLLDLAYATTSSFDGVAIFGANHDARRIEVPSYVQHRGVDPMFE